MEAGDVSGAPLGADIGTVEALPEAAARYAAFCRASFPGADLAGISMVLDCANGATSSVAARVFSALGAEVSVINDAPNGVNINEDCGSEHTEGLSRKVRELRADIGLAFDGDGDRLIAIDELGARLTGDQVIAICARLYKEMGWLANNVVVTTIMSNLGLSRALAGLGVSHQMSQVGDRHVVKMMHELDAAVGGEESGHLIFRRAHSTGDGIIAGLQVLGAMRRYGRPLSELAGLMVVLPQTIVNVDVASKPPLDDIPGLREAIDESEASLGSDGRILVRYSGTQAMCRVMVEAADSEASGRVAELLAGIISREIGPR
jgi:phosphoglucosamine mutase